MNTEKAKAWLAYMRIFITLSLAIAASLIGWLAVNIFATEEVATPDSLLIWSAVALIASIGVLFTFSIAYAKMIQKL